HRASLLLLLIELSFALLKGLIELRERLRLSVRALRGRDWLRRHRLKDTLHGGLINRRRLYIQRPRRASTLLRWHRLSEADLHRPERAALYVVRRCASVQSDIAGALLRDRLAGGGFERDDEGRALRLEIDRNGPW